VCPMSYGYLLSPLLILQLHSSIAHLLSLIYPLSLVPYPESKAVILSPHSHLIPCSLVICCHLFSTVVILHHFISSHLFHHSSLSLIITRPSFIIITLPQITAQSLISVILYSHSCHLSSLIISHSLSSGVVNSRHSSSFPLLSSHSLSLIHLSLFFLVSHHQSLLIGCHHSWSNSSSTSYLRRPTSLSLSNNSSSFYFNVISYIYGPK